MGDYKRERNSHDYFLFGACLLVSYVMWSYQKCDSDNQVKFRDGLKSKVDSTVVVDSVVVSDSIEDCLK